MAAVPLREMYLEVTNSCPLRCIHCSANSGEPYEDELPAQRMLELLAEAKRLGLEKLLVTGGEPLSRPSLTHALLERAGDLPEVSLLTNGVLLDAHWADELAKLRSTLRVEMSIYGATSPIHDEVTQRPGSFAKTKRATVYCRERGIPVAWEFVFTALNADQVLDVVALAEKCDVDTVSIIRLMRSGRAAANWDILALSPNELTRTLDLVKEFEASFETDVKRGRPVNFDFVSCDEEPSLCKAGVEELFVQADGETFGCPGFKDLPDFWGKNVRNTSLEECWNTSPAFQRLRRFLVDGEGTICPGCPHADLCRGHCVAQRLRTYQGDLQRGPDPLCPLGVSRVTEPRAQPSLVPA
jgi:pyrroloquinoline quinone biosynthesis protein E